MSMGPEIKEEIIETSKIEKAFISTKKTTEVFFKDPIHYIFYISLAVIIGSLFFGKSYSWELYVIVFSLGAIKFYNFLKLIDIDNK